MCFDNDGEWGVSFQTDETVIATEPHKCVECRRIITVGELVRQIYQQEQDDCECEYCENQDDPDPEYEGPAECEEQVGNTFSCHICRECSQILEAIKAVEVEEGCPEYAQQPLFGELSDVFTEHEQAFLYAQRAVDMFPGLYSHPFIANLID